jgi:hypothetical protein
MRSRIGGGDDDEEENKREYSSFSLSLSLSDSTHQNTSTRLDIAVRGDRGDGVQLDRRVIISNSILFKPL